jgi:hypothetical protein
MTSSASPPRAAIGGQGLLLKIGSKQGVVNQSIPDKKDNTLRIGFNNINGFPFKRGSTKQHDMILFTRAGQFDLFGMAEANTHWKNANIHLKVREFH